MANPWDHSSIIMGNQAGANWSRGIEQVGQAFGKGIKQYYERKELKEKEESTVDWLNQNEAAVNQLFPQLAQVKDPVERKKVIRAGIKGAGLENLVQVRNFTEQQRRAQQREGIEKEMAGLQLEGARLGNRNLTEQMDERASEGRALRKAAAPGAALHDQIMRGARFEQLDPNAEPDRAEIYMREGGRDPRIMQAMAKSRPFSPQEFMTPSGLNMVQTSPSSFIPDPRVRAKAGKAPANPGGPEYSKDKKYYRSGPDDAWKPVRPGTAAKLDPVQLAEINALPGEIAELERKITAAAGETRKGNKKPGPDWLPGADSYDDKVKKMQADLEAKKRRLKELGRLTAGDDEEEADEDAPAAPARPADPYSYVLGN